MPDIWLHLKIQIEKKNFILFKFRVYQNVLVHLLWVNTAVQLHAHLFMASQQRDNQLLANRRESPHFFFVD